MNKAQRKIIIDKRKVTTKAIQLEFYNKRKGVPFLVKGTECVFVEELKGFELVFWLRKNGFRNLAKALKTAMSRS